MRLYLVTRMLLLCGAAAVLASCGGGSSSSSTSNTPATITATPSSLSLTHGDVAGFSVSVANSSGTAITPTPTVTYTSANPALVTVTSAGLICAGVFDSNNIVCQTKDSSGNPLPDQVVNVTATSGGLTATVPVYVHRHVDNIIVSGPANPPVCVSQNQTEQFTARVFTNVPGNPQPVDITANVGPLTWSTGSGTVATVDSNGVATSRQPGATTVVASVANTTGTPAVVVACPPKTISLHLTGVTDTTFSVATGTTETLVADVTDILGQPITGASLTFSSYIPTAAAITSAGAVTTPGAGVTTLIASCVPPGCNQASGPNVNFNGTGAGLAVYSNPVIGTVTGTTATTIYVTGSDKPDSTANTSLIPIDSAANTAGTAITLPGSPNSMVFSRAGSKAYLGSSVGMLIFDPGTNTVTATASGITGVVLTVSNDGNKVVISDTSAGKVFVFDAVANTAQTFDLAGVTNADFDSDNSKAYFTSGSALYEYSPSTGLKTLSGAADGVAFTPQGAVAYLGGSSILGLAVCNDSPLPGAAGAANILAPMPDGTHMVGVGSGGWTDVSYSVVNSNGCPPTTSNTGRNAALPAFVGTPTSIAVASDDSNAFLTGYSGGSAATGVPFYHFADGTTGTIALVNPGGVLFSGGLTQDAHSLYVGTAANGSTGPFVHRIDLTATGGPTDANQISVTFNPRIVVVRPK
ncbi:MAG TPA: hypothetical protein VNX88_07605 [Terriglobales bacterium]|jgi:hypothetical protein|nr:hypothetical protein [Terriglobales bacterium]